MSNEGEKKEVLFDLSDDALYVANSGHTFTREGVIGICASHLSEKRSNQSDNYKCKDKDLISKILKREIKTYQNDNNRVDSDAHAEQEIGHDYDGRFAWELLQNADDVMGPPERQPAELIGTKGLGFKSVLEITEEPEIYSGSFNFKFSPDKTQKLLRNKNIHADPPRLTFRIPHSCQPTSKVLKLLEMGYSTVIRLPFRDREAQNKAGEVLKNLDPYFLLLSQQLESVRIIQSGEEERIFRILRDTKGLSNGRVVLDAPGNQSAWQRWVATQNITGAKRLTVAVAIPLNESGEAVSLTEELPFHVFFPTEQRISVKALLHASFDLEQNRKHLRKGYYDEDIMALFGNVLEKMILDVPPRTILEIFRDIDQYEDDDGKLTAKIAKIIWEKMRTTPFVPVLGGEHISPQDSNCWKDELGQVLREDEKNVKDARLPISSLSDLFPVLTKLGASEISDNDYLQLLRYCRYETLEDCIKSFNVLVKGGLKRVEVPYQQDSREKRLELLRQVPCWWINDGRARELDAMPSLVWEKPQDWPDWLAADSLHPEIRKEIEKWEEQQEQAIVEKWKSLTEQFLSREKKHYIHWILIPFVKDWGQQDWENQGFESLNWFMYWESTDEFNKIKPWIRGEEGRRNTLAAILHLPTDKSWLPAIDCFAGKAWDGPKVFDSFYKDKEGHGIVQPLEKWPDDLQITGKEKWKALLRWIGVSWEPNVRRTQDYTISDHPLWQTYDSIWCKYNTVTRNGGWNYLIQDFPDCITGIGSTELLGTIFPTLFESVNKRARRDWQRPSGYKMYNDSPRAFALEQLRKEAWLPVKRSLLEDRSHIPSNRAFLPGNRLNGLLPEVDKSNIDDDTWHGKDNIKAKLIELGVMNKLPSDDEKWYLWMRKLAETGRRLEKEEREAPPDWKDSEAKILWRAARSLYREYLKKEISRSFPKDLKIPHVRFDNGHRILDFSEGEQVYWIDEAHLADPTLENELLSQQYRLFIFRLQEVAEVDQLSVRRLSNIIKCQSDYQKLHNGETEVLFRRYRQRRVALEKLTKTQLQEDLQIKAVKNLILRLSANDKELGECPVYSWKEGEASPILVDVEKNKWRAFADALAHRLRDDEMYTRYANDFEVYLADDDDDSVLERLRSAGIPEEALDEVNRSFSSPDGSSVKDETAEVEPENSIQSEIHGIQGTNNVSLSDPTIGNDATSQATKGGNSGTTRVGGSSKNRDKPVHSSGGEGRISDPRPETGLDAERWLEDRLREQWPDQVKKVHEGRDFIITCDELKIHIEAKHVETRPGSIHWSRSQYETCKNKKKNPHYFIALLSPNESNNTQYDIHWIWEPLENLKNLERNVVWIGKSKPTPLQKGDWSPETLKHVPPELQPDTFSIQIKLNNELFHSDNWDNHELEKLKMKSGR